MCPYMWALTYQGGKNMVCRSKYTVVGKIKEKKHKVAITQQNNKEFYEMNNMQ